MPVLNPEERLRSLIQADQDPLLSNDEVETLLFDHARDTGYVNWEPSTVYTVGQIVQPRVGNNHIYECTIAGTSDSSEPIFPDPPFSTVVDGTTLTWREAGAIISYNLNRAAAAGWRLKAAKVANRYDVDIDRYQKFMRSQLVKHCLKMAQQFSGRTPQALLISGGYTNTLDPVIGNVNNG